jgi:hypothetical protein
LLDTYPYTIRVFSDSPLHDNSTFSDPINNINIKQLSHNPESVTVEISFSPVPTRPPKPTPQPFICDACRADLNRSGMVEIKDISWINQCYSHDSDDEVNGALCVFADINNDGFVNDVDANCVQSNFSNTCYCTACSANIDRDDEGYVNILDFSRISACYGKDGFDYDINSHQCNRTDINNDKTTNDPDVECIKSKYGNQCFY